MLPPSQALAEDQAVWGATREAALTDDLVRARRDLQSEPLHPSRLQAVALAAAALRDYHATAVAAVQAMVKEQEDPFMARAAPTTPSLPLSSFPGPYDYSPHLP